MNELLLSQTIKMPTKEQQIENQRKRIKELEDGIRNLHDVAKPFHSLNDLYAECERLYKLIGIEP